MFFEVELDKTLLFKLIFLLILIDFFYIMEEETTSKGIFILFLLLIREFAFTIFGATYCLSI